LLRNTKSGVRSREGRGFGLFGDLCRGWLANRGEASKKQGSRATGNKQKATEGGVNSLRTLQSLIRAIVIKNIENLD